MSPKSERILLRGANWLGDAVMSTPALLRLREARPDAHITLLTHEKLSDLWLNHPAVDAVLTFAAGETIWSVVKKLRSARASIWLLANASGKVSSMPITSPVDRISGPRITSTPGNFVNGNTTSFTEMCFGSGSSLIPNSASDLPAITFAAILAHGTPVALPTNGTVRDARGFTSRT